MHAVNLEGMAGARRGRLRELSGVEERAIRDTTTATAVELIDRLLVSETDEDLKPGRTVDLPTWQRDRLLAAVYETTYGERVDTTATCGKCEQALSIDFSLSALVQSLDQSKDHRGRALEPDGTYHLPGKKRFRPPTGADELAVRDQSPEVAEAELTKRCQVAGECGMSSEEMQGALKELAPVLDLEVPITCPDCQSEQAVRFNLQSYLLTALMRERRQLGIDVHRLARAYGWSLSEILSLSRTERRLFVSLVEDELAVEGRALA